MAIYFNGFIQYYNRSLNGSNLMCDYWSDLMIKIDSILAA